MGGGLMVFFSFFLFWCEMKRETSVRTSNLSETQSSDLCVCQQGRQLMMLARHVYRRGHPPLTYLQCMPGTDVDDPRCLCWLTAVVFQRINQVRGVETFRVRFVTGP